MQITPSPPADIFGGNMQVVSCMGPTTTKNGQNDPISYTRVVYDYINQFLAIFKFFRFCAAPTHPCTS